MLIIIGIGGGKDKRATAFLLKKNSGKSETIVANLKIFEQT